MNNQLKLILTIIFAELSMLIGNADAHYACFDFNQLIDGSNPAALAAYTDNIYCSDLSDKSDIIMLDAITGNNGGFAGTSFHICNDPGFVQSSYSISFNGISPASMSLCRFLDSGTSHELAAFAGNSIELEFFTQSLACRPSDGSGIAHCDLLVRISRPARSGLRRMQLDNLCETPMPEPAAVGLVHLFLADWFSLVNVNKQVVRF